MAIEYERKFRATPALLAAIAAAYPVDGVYIRMETTYYDTPAGDLSARRYTLRKRLENGISVCTVKAPAGAARGEWEAECDRIENAIPKLQALGCPEEIATLAQKGLIPICGAEFTRQATTISLPEGVVELALDQGFLTGGDRREPLCEVEVELKIGSTLLCDRFAQELADRYGLQPEEKSKFRRALALYKGE